MNRELFNGLRGATVLVTGATGFIGANVCPLLAEYGAHVKGVCHSNPVGKTNSLESLEQVDLGDLARVRQLLETLQPELILHLGAMVTASRDPALVLPMMQANLVSTVNLIDTAVKTGVKRVVLAGSFEEPKPGTRPTSAYAASKAAQALYSDLYTDLTDLEIANVKIGMGYGLRQRDETKLVPYVITELLEGRAPSIGSGKREADWIFSSDIASGFAAVLAAAELPDHPLLLGTGKLTSVREVVDTLVQLSGTGIEPGYGDLPDRKNELANAAAPVLMTQSLGWSPAVDLAEGLRQTWEWYCSR